MWVRFVLGLLMTVVCLGIAGRRAFFLYRVVQKFQPLEAERLVDAGSAVRAEAVSYTHLTLPTIDLV